MTIAPYVIIADDESHIRKVVSWKLRQAGFEVQECSDGAEVLNQVCLRRPDLIISDYEMPHLDGIEMSVELAQRPEHATIPVILVTGRGHRIDTAVIAATGVRVVMSKPFSPSELIENSKELLSYEDRRTGSSSGASSI